MKAFMEKYFPLYADPVEWAGRFVKTWFHFLFWGLILTIATFGTISRAAEHGIDAVRYSKYIIVFFILMLLYALRRLYLRITDTD